jgi:RNA polymerase sigma-70 factor (ECF subfamily)
MQHEIGTWVRNMAVAKLETPDCDTALARRISGGDVQAWDEFFNRYSGWAYRFAYGHLNGNHADAEDLCSDILMVAAGSIGKYDATRGSLDVWLLGIARHRFARFCRRRHLELPTVPEAAIGSEQDDRDLESITNDMLTRESVNRALASLPERQSTVLIEKYVEEYSMEEIARIEGTTPKAIESLLSRARRSFRAALETVIEVAERGR